MAVNLSAQYPLEQLLNSTDSNGVFD